MIGAPTFLVRYRNWGDGHLLALLKSPEPSNGTAPYIVAIPTNINHMATGSIFRKRQLMRVLVFNHLVSFGFLEY